MGCDPKSFRRIYTYAMVSIHAPIWGATDFGNAFADGYEFQSTHPYGVRRPSVADNLQSVTVSIHAPIWGATYFEFVIETNKQFQSTHPYGVRLNTSQSNMAGYNEFQSTHPYGVRPFADCVVFETEEFQSTHPYGVRHKVF